MELETRTTEAFETDEPLEFRAGEGDKPPMLVGYAAVYGVLSQDLGGFRERILPGAFKNSLASGADIRALVNHDPGKLLGRTSNGTLRVIEDHKGLRVEIDLPDTSYANDLRAMVTRRDIRSMSFGFLTPPGGDRFITEGNKTVRELRTVNLKEVSVVATPAYPQTSIALRVDPSVISRAKEPPKPRMAKCERILRTIE